MCSRTIINQSWQSHQIAQLVLHSAPSFCAFILLEAFSVTLATLNQYKKVVILLYCRFKRKGSIDTSCVKSNEVSGRRDLLWQRWHGRFSWIALWRPVHRSRCLFPPHWSGPSPPLDTAADRQGGIKGSFKRRFNTLTECCLPRRLCKWGAATSVFLHHKAMGHSLTMLRCSIKLLPNCTQLCYNWIIGDWDAFS